MQQDSEKKQSLAESDRHLIHRLIQGETLTLQDKADVPPERLYKGVFKAELVAKIYFY